jgi:transcriptional regulator with XRE-family HTH domain
MVDAVTIAAGHLPPHAYATRFREILGSNIRSDRQRRGLGLCRVAAAAGLQPCSLLRIERGLAPEFNAATHVRIAQVLLDLSRPG